MPKDAVTVFPTVYMGYDRHCPNDALFAQCFLLFSCGSRQDSLLMRKVASSNPAGAAGEFSSPESTLRADCYLV